jgi:hypothetical protein
VDTHDRSETRHGLSGWLKPVMGIALIAMLAGAWYFYNPGFAPKLDSRIDYYAVALNNGQMIYGHPESVCNGSVVLTDVYFVVRQTNPQTNEVRNTLVPRRKSEWHSPAKMILNAGNVLLMEPVDPASSVAKLIAEQKAKGE